jgi:hypothetical protein
LLCHVINNMFCDPYSARYHCTYFFNVSSLVEWSPVSLHACCHVLPIRNLLTTHVVFIYLIGGYCILKKNLLFRYYMGCTLVICSPFTLPFTTCCFFNKTSVGLMLYGRYFSYLRNDNNSFLNQKRQNTPKCLRNDSKKQKWLPVPANRKGTYLIPIHSATVVNNEQRCFIALSRLRDLAALHQRNRQEGSSEVRTTAQRNRFQRANGFQCYCYIPSQTTVSALIDDACYMPCKAKKRWTPMISTVGVHDDFFHAFRVRQTFGNRTCIPDDVHRIV